MAIINATFVRGILSIIFILIWIFAQSDVIRAGEGSRGTRHSL